MQGDPKTRWRLKSMYQHLHGSIKVAIRVSKNYSKVANLKMVKIQNCQLIFFLSSSSSRLNHQQSRNKCSLILACIQKPTCTEVNKVKKCSNQLLDKESMQHPLAFVSCVRSPHGLVCSHTMCKLALHFFLQPV